MPDAPGTAPKISDLPIRDIIADPHAQFRVSLDPAVVEKYVGIVVNGGKFEVVESADRRSCLVDEKTVRNVIKSEGLSADRPRARPREAASR
jgi:hypothetical protein